MAFCATHAYRYALPHYKVPFEGVLNMYLSKLTHACMFSHDADFDFFLGNQGLRQCQCH